MSNIPIVPKNISKFIKKLLEDKREEDELKYGYGKFSDLQKDYIRESDYGDDSPDTSIANISIQGSIFLAPSGMEKLRVEVV